ncbi:MAG: DUF4836 family protein [Rikenellaceae bacterium]
MKSKITLKLALLVIILISIVSCSSVSKEDYVSLIPKDVTQLISINCASVYEKADLDNPENNKYKDEVKNTINKKVSGSAATLFNSIIDDPSIAGIDLNAPIYMFLTGGEILNPSLVAKMNDTALFEALIQELVNEEALKATVEADGFKYSEFTQDNAALLYDDKSVLIVVEAGNKENSAIQIGTKLFEQSKPENIYDNEGFTKMLSFDGDIKLISSVKSLPKEINSQLKTLNSMSDIDITNLNVIGSLRFDKGEVNLDISYYTEDAELKNMLADLLKNTKELNGNLLKMIPGDALAAIVYYVKGDAISKQIEETKEFTKEFAKDPQTKEDILNFVKTINGDFVFSPVYINNMSDYSILAYAEIESNGADALEAIYNNKKINNKLFVKKDENQYAYESRYISIYFGIKDDLFYLTNKKNQEIGKTENPSIASTYKSYEDKYSYMMVNFGEVLDVVNKMGMTRQIPRKIRPVLNELKYLEAGNTTNGDANIKVILNNSDVNSLKFFLDLVKTL